jgi:osmotically inducible lipoprotein OsmB
MRIPSILALAASALVLAGCGQGVEQRAATGGLTGLAVAGPVGAAAGAATGAAIAEGAGEGRR